MPTVIAMWHNGSEAWPWPAAQALPKEGYFELTRGRYGPVYSRTPAGYGFTITAKVIEGRDEAIRTDGSQLEAAVAAQPDVSAPLRRQLFDVGSGLHFRYQGIFDTDFAKYTEDAVKLFSSTGITTAFIQFVRDHQVPSFLGYGEYPSVTSDEIEKALRLKAAFADKLDQMQ